MKNLIHFLFVPAILFSCSKINNVKIAKAYIATHNEHDVSKALSFYHPDVVFELKNTWTKKGLEEMRSLEVWDSTLNSSLKLESLKIMGDSVFCKIIENNDWFRAADIHDLTHDPVIFIFEDQKIKGILAYPSEKTGKQIQQTIGSIMQWSQKHQDSTIYSLIPNGQFVYSSESAVKWMNLFKRWKEDN